MTPLIEELINEISNLLKEKQTRDRSIGKWRIMEEEEPDGNIYPEILVRDIGFSKEVVSFRYVFVNNKWMYIKDDCCDEYEAGYKYKPCHFHIWKPYTYYENLPSKEIIEKVKKGKTKGIAFLL